MTTKNTLEQEAIAQPAQSRNNEILTVRVIVYFSRIE